MISLIAWWIYLGLGLLGAMAVANLPQIMHSEGPFGMVLNGLLEAASQYAYLPLVAASILAAISFYQNRQPEYVARRYLGNRRGWM